MKDGEKLFLAIVLFLVLKGLLDPKDAKDRERVKRLWRREKGLDKDPRQEPIWSNLDL